jgi:twinkle protein
MDVNTKIKEVANKFNVGQYKTKCPLCQDQRSKHKGDKPLSLNVEHDKVIYNCHHCGENGVVYNQSNVVQMKGKKTVKNTLKNIPKNNPKSKSVDYLESRGIDIDVAYQAGVVCLDKEYLPVIGFRFGTEDKVEAIKYRSADTAKKFWWEGTAQKLWGLSHKDNDLKSLDDTVVITEGEIDALSILTAFKGYANIDVYSVPNGAPSKITDNKVDPSEDGRFKYVWEDREKFENKERIILATDNDTSGDVLADELSRRMNKAKCYRVNYDSCKDANELLQTQGAEALRAKVLNCEPIPLHGLNNIDHYSDDFQSLYDKGMPTGISTGFSSVDELFTLATGNLYVVSGHAGDGKSAFIDQLVVNVGKNYGWKTCFCSFEKPPQLHAVQLSQILTGKPFFQGVNQRMTQEDKDNAESWIREHILFQDYIDGDMPTIEKILEKGASAVMRKGVRVLVIDPFNFIQTDKQYALETDMVSDMLTKVQLFAKQHDILVFFVAHPTKPIIRDGKKNVITGVDIAKSYAWFSKCDTGITVYRGQDGVEIHNWKQRWGWHGKTGHVIMDYNSINGRFIELSDEQDDFDWEFD